MSKESRNKKIDKIKKLIRNTVIAILAFIFIYRFSLTTIPIYGALYFYYPLFEKVTKGAPFLEKLKKYFVPAFRSLQIDGKRTFLNRVSVFQNRYMEGNESDFTSDPKNPNLPPHFSLVNTREPTCDDACQEKLSDMRNFRIYRVNYDDLNIWQKMIYSGFSVVQVIVSVISAFVLWCGCWLPRSNYSLFAFDTGIICNKTPDLCKINGHLKAGMNLKRFWTWLTTLGIDREVYNLKYLLTIINNKSLQSQPEDGSCETPGINVGFDKWWCRIKKIYIYILIIYCILQIVGAGMKTNFSKIVTGFGGATALLFSIIFIAYFFVFKGFKFMSFTSKDSIIFPGFNINGTNFNENDGKNKVATTMFTNRNLQELLLAEAGIKPQSLQYTLSKMCQTIISAKNMRKKLKLSPPPSPTSNPRSSSPGSIEMASLPPQSGGGSNKEKMISSKKLEEFKELLSEIIS
jgi:hypothetical protein